MNGTDALSSNPPTSMTAEAFMSSIVCFVRQHHIHTIELHNDHTTHTESQHLVPPTVRVTARLTSALSWPQNKHDTKNHSIFTQHITFRHPLSQTPPLTRPAPCAVLGADWCAALQRRLAVCAVFTGLPRQLHISAAPHVPLLVWDRARDGVWGATHCATASVTLRTETDQTEREAHSKRETIVLHKGEEAHRAEWVGEVSFLLQAAVLLNASIPLGSRAMQNTAVLFLHAPNAILCAAGFPVNVHSNNGDSHRIPTPHKRTREWAETHISCTDGNFLETPHQNCGRNVSLNKHYTSATPAVEVEEMFTLLNDFTAHRLLPALSWSCVWSHMRHSEEGLTQTNTERESLDTNVCGLRGQLGCSCYLDGRLDARGVRSLTVLLDIPPALLSRLMPWLRHHSATHSAHPKPFPQPQPHEEGDGASFLCTPPHGFHGRHSLSYCLPPPCHDGLGAALWEALPKCLASTMEGALSRLAAENLDSFRPHSQPAGFTGPMETQSPTLPTVSQDAKGGEWRQSTWPLLAQSIADSLAQIVRASENRLFVAEVHRLLRPWEDAKGRETRGAAFDAPSVSSPTLEVFGAEERDSKGAKMPSQRATAALLRWAVESRLME